MLVGQLLLGSGVWQDCQSLPTRTLHQQTHSPSRGQGKHHDPILHCFLTQRAGRAILWHSRFSCVCAIHVLGCCGFSFTIGIIGHVILTCRLGIHLHAGCFSFLTQLRNCCWFPHDFGLLWVHLHFGVAVGSY